MHAAGPGPDESLERFEHFLGNLLRIGVLTAAAVVLVGGCIYLVRNARQPVEYGTFVLDPVRLPGGAISAAREGHGRGIIQVGLLLLIATPVARVVFSVFGFARQRDVTYVVLTLIVMGVLMYSLFFESP